MGRTHKMKKLQYTKVLCYQKQHHKVCIASALKAIELICWILYFNIFYDNKRLKVCCKKSDFYRSKESGMGPFKKFRPSLWPGCSKCWYLCSNKAGWLVPRVWLTLFFDNSFSCTIVLHPSCHNVWNFINDLSTLSPPQCNRP